MLTDVTELLMARLLLDKEPRQLKLDDLENVLVVDRVASAELHAKLTYFALKKKDKELLEFLLKLPAFSDTLFYKYCGNTPLGVVLEESGVEEFIPLLLAYTCKEFALHVAAKLGNKSIVNRLLQLGRFRPKILRYLGIEGLKGNT